MASRLNDRESAHLSSTPKVSVILAVVNEARHLQAAIASVLASNYAGEIEVIIAVGPSQDGTLAIAKELAASDRRVRIIENPSGRTPDGLNAALSFSQHEVVVRIDGHSEIESDYIARAIEIMLETGAVNVGGVMAAEGVTTFESAVARAMRSPIGVGVSRFHTGGIAGSVDTVYLGVFRRSALLEVGGYDSRFTRAQDWELNYRLRTKGGIVWFDPSLSVKYRPRSNLRSLADQYFNYGKWRRAVGRQHQGSSNLRYLAPPVNIFLQLISFICGIFFSPYFFLPIIGYLAFIGVGSIFVARSWGEFIRLPMVLITMHFSWGMGFILSSKHLISSSR